MACRRIGNAIVCGGSKSMKLGKCQECWTRNATLLCDGPLPAGVVHRRSSIPGADKTCSKPICALCATNAGPNEDYCKDHADPKTRELAL
jgi:hypothetical protein